MFPVPQINDDNRAFWTGGADGALRIIRCGQCEYWVHPPAPRCPKCLSDDVAPQAVSGLGTIYSYTINDRQWTPDVEVPYVIAIVALDEQSDLRLMTNVVGCAPEAVEIGLPVRVEFRPQGEAYAPVFRPVAP